MTFDKSLTKRETRAAIVGKYKHLFFGPTVQTNTTLIDTEFAGAIEKLKFRDMLICKQLKLISSSGSNQSMNGR